MSCEQRNCIRRSWSAFSLKPHPATAVPYTGMRPYIYVYDMKSDYSTDMLQYRIEGAHCLYRWGNTSL